MAIVRKSSMFAQASLALSLITTGALGFGNATVAHAQAAPRITGPVEGSAMVSLPGEVHPWARPQFDRGVAPANLNGHMLVVLKRSDEQEAALRSLLASQQDPHSPNYHKWLTPEDFGKRFGAADSDVQNVTSYLSGQGMRVGRVYGNHMAIEVEATAGQIHSAFQTEIHAYSVAGKTFYANNSDPKIPSALSKVVSGFASLNSFHAEGGSGAGTQATLDPTTHTLHPLYTISSSSNTYAVSPADLRTIYNIPAATAQGLGGKNVNVGIVGDSEINVQYINNYRTTFGLGTNPPIVVVDGNEPGVNSDAYIAYKQIELVSAVAPNATIYYYTSATTDYDSGIYFALTRAVNDNTVQVLLNGMQECETAIGSSAMNLVNGLAEQAAAQGITFVAAAGNTGSAGCAIPGTSGSLSGAAYAVNGFASSPYLTSVGGTDFYYGTNNNYSTYWSTTNTGYSSAIKYIPEQVWNDSYTANNGSNAVSGTSVQYASGGGPSTAGLDGTATPNPIPSYQSSNANANSIGGGIARVIPDVSFFAGSGSNDTLGYNNTAYLFCMQPGDCLSTGTVSFTYSGGTEASSAVFAGAVALAVANYNSSSRFGLGNINPSLYSQLNNTIISHDITKGTNALACSSGTNCSGGHMSGYNAGNGYDAASGLGSFDISSFVINYKAPNTTASTVTLNVTDVNGNALPTCTVNGATSHCITHSTWIKFAVSASGSGGTPTGDVAIFSSSPLASQQAVEALTLSGGAASDTWNLLPGGTYNLYARYAGDTKYAPSVSSTPYSITISAENCQMKVYGHNVTTGTATNIPYGSSVSITAEPYSSISTTNVGIPSGSIRVFDNSTQITTLPINSEGAATFTSNLLAFGSHSLVLTFAGDASFNSCSTPAYLANIVKAATITALNSPELDVGDSGSTQTLGITAVVTSATTPSNGIAPTGTVTFSTVTPKTVTLTPGYDANGNSIATASTTIGQNDIPAGGNVTATYNPATTEVNYTGSTSSAVNFYPSIALINSNSTTTFYITDDNGNTFPSTGTYPNTDNQSFPALDSLTLHMHVKATSPNSTVFLVYANGVLLTPATWSGGYLTSGGLPIDSSGNATFTLPQLNGYLALPSGKVQLTVVYDGWITPIVTQSNPSSANQIFSIVDDRTSADFSLQSDTTVNQSAPLRAATSTTQTTYNLRLTSIYNFVSAYGTTPINLSCTITGYSLAGVRSAVPAGLACGFASGPSGTTTSVKFSTSNTGFITLPIYVGAASGYAIASNTAPAQPAPATRWWVTGGGATLACVFLLGLPARRRKWQSLLGVCVLMIVGFSMTGCGVTAASGPDQQGYNSLNGGSSGANGNTSPASPVPAGTYTVTVTATAQTNTTLVHTLPLQVLVGTTN